LQAVGKGIMLFGPVSSGAVISGNLIANVSAVANKEGVGIFFDSAGTSNHSVTGNVIKNCDGAAIAAAGPNNDLVISSNIIENVNLRVAGAALQVSSGSRILISANNLVSSGTPVSAGVDAVIVNNPGINPVGNVNHPWPASGDLTNQVPGGSAHPHSGVVYTVRQSPKTILVSGGTVSQIAINGLSTGLTAGLFKLGIGETIAITFGIAPAAAVFAE
jgi:parallel beta helix pectate lyase-like protein